MLRPVLKSALIAALPIISLAVEPAYGQRLRQTGKPLSTLPSTQLAALLNAGKYVKVGNEWRGCDRASRVDFKPNPEYPDNASRLIDLNGDGVDEAIVVDVSTECYGNTGQAFQIMQRTATGGWRIILSETGMAVPLASTGVQGFADIELGGPGFCFTKMRWNGVKYAVAGESYNGAPCGRTPTPSAAPRPVPATPPSTSQVALPGSVWETIPGPPISALSPIAGALDSLMLSCTGTGRGVRVSAKLPREMIQPTLGLSFIAGPGRIVSVTLNHSRAQWWSADLDAPRLVELLTGPDRALTYTINGRPGGLLSLKGSTAILRTVLAACPNARASAPASSVPTSAAGSAGWTWRYVDRDGDLKAAWGGPESGWDYTLNCDVRGRAIVFESFGATPSSGRRATITAGASAPTAGVVIFETEGMESGKVALPAASQVWTDLAAGKSPLKVRWSGGPVDELPNAPALRRLVSECRARLPR